MNLNLRPMHESETPLVRDSWTRSIDASEHKDSRGRKDTINGRMRQVGANNCPWMRIGADDSMVTWAWHAMHRAWVKSLWDGLDVIVAAHPANDELVGWCAMTPAGQFPLVVHYLFVLELESARRQGVATTLLRAALRTADHRPVRFSHMTPVGRQMVESAHRMPTREPVAPMRDGVRMH